VRPGLFRVTILLFVAALVYPQTDTVSSHHADPDHIAAEHTEQEDESPQTAEEEDVVRLPDVEVNAKKETTEYITQEQMEREGSEDLWEALRHTPGVIRDGGGGMRNESNFTVRGFDEMLMPVFIDGVPMAMPYRGDGDHARFLTGDLEGIEIQKGYSSMLLGANTMGGAITMRIARPKKPFEAFFKTSFDIDNIGKIGGSTHILSLGTKQDLFYGKTTLQYRDIDHYRLSEKFEPVPNALQGTGERLFSDSTDLKLTLLAGWTPGEALDINLTYVYQDSNKGVSPPEITNKAPSFDVWPTWKRQSVSLNGAYTMNTYYVKALAYFDKYDNTLSKYSSWENLAKGNETHDRDYPSDYDDYGTGGRLEGGYHFNSWNTLEAALTFKQEGHRDNKDGTSTKDIRENTWSLGAEYSMNPWKPLTLTAGVGLDVLSPQDFWSINDYKESGPLWMLSWQAGIFYDLTPNHEFHFTYARKNHIPTMTARYSDSMAVPNPDLKPEQAYHYELGYKGYFFNKINVTTAVYYSDITDLIAEKQVIEDGRQIKKRFNIDATAFYGFELGAELYLFKYFSAGGALALNRYEVKHNEEGQDAIGNYPKTTTNAYLVIRAPGNAFTTDTPY
jgi:iron complex outermembrane receptor protein